MVTHRSQSWSWMIDSQPFLSTSISAPTPIPQIRLFQTLTFNTLRPRQNGRRFTDDTFKRIFFNEKVRISIKISLKFVPKGPINNIPSLVQTSHYLNQWWLVYWRIYASLGLNELNYKIKVMDVVKDHIISPVSNWFTFFLFHINQIIIPQIQLFWNLTLKNQRSWSWVRSKVKVT